MINDFAVAMTKLHDPHKIGHVAHMPSGQFNIYILCLKKMFLFNISNNSAKKLIDFMQLASGAEDWTQ